MYLHQPLKPWVREAKQYKYKTHKHSQNTRAHKTTSIQKFITLFSANTNTSPIYLVCLNISWPKNGCLGDCASKWIPFNRRSKTIRSVSIWPSNCGHNIYTLYINSSISKRTCKLLARQQNESVIFDFQSAGFWILIWELCLYKMVSYSFSFFYPLVFYIFLNDFYSYVKLID